ncbi:MAG: aspartate 1-decarboxylase [Ignavibacteria bacterium]|nr:aspartate 1-decarboxylase [Ignavibacteria bacterium]
MQRIMLKSKIHRAKVTEANLYYEGSITIDKNLLEAADILNYEKVSVLDINSGSRFDTYVITGEAGSGTICINGAAARLVAIGDEVIILSYVNIEDSQAANHEPVVILVDENNNIKNKGSEISAGKIFKRN